MMAVAVPCWPWPEPVQGRCEEEEEAGVRSWGGGDSLSETSVLIGLCLSPLFLAPWGPPTPFHITSYHPEWEGLLLGFEHRGLERSLSVGECG